MTRYVHRRGRHVCDPAGNPLQFRGVGIGGWSLIEGYMIQSFGAIDRPRRLQEHITRLTDEDTARWFQTEWVRRFFTREDVRLIADLGFNCIRIPFDYAWLFEPSDQRADLMPNDASFDRLDDVLRWCDDAGLYVILDLHGAPGGQTGTNIDNSEHDRPELFQSRLYQAQTIHVWKTIASRYRDWSVVAAYDLLNEPLPNWFAQYNDQLMPLYQDIIAAIRMVDPHHMITLEGWHWSTDLSGFTKRLDDNLLVQFHKYWSAPDQESLASYLALREDLEVPLFMGEGGENNPLWYASLWSLYDQLDISWCFWTYKKMTATNGIVTYPKPSKWEAFLAQATTKDETVQVLSELLVAVELANGEVRHDVVNHLLRRHAYQLYAFAYDLGGHGVSHHTNSVHAASIRTVDGVCIANQEGRVIPPNFKQYGGEDVPPEERLFVWLEPLEWVRYTLDNPTGRLCIGLDSDVTEYVALTIDQGHVWRRKTDWILTSNEERITVRLRALRPVRLGVLTIQERATNESTASIRTTL